MTIEESQDIEEIQEIPTEYSLMQNYPNPFNPNTRIQFALPNSQRVKITVYNMMGEEVNYYWIES